MRTVYKYQMPVADDVRLRLPVGATLVHLAADAPGSLVGWFEVNTTAPTEERVFHTYGTGHQIAPGDKHLRSVIADPFVWHVYEPTRSVPDPTTHPKGQNDGPR